MRWQIDGPGGGSIKFGYLAQMRADAVDNGSDTATDLYFRRRLHPGRRPAAGRGDLQLQPVSRIPAVNGLWAEQFRLGGAAGYARRAGLRCARGYLFSDRLEYRASILQGVRGAGSSNDLRFLGRLMFNVFEAQKGLFYIGTTLGKKQILSFGVSYDTQEDYNTVSVDGFWDQPLAGGNAMTVQANWSNVDGGDFLAAFPEQTNVFVEAGFLHGPSKVMPFLQYTEKDFDSAALGDVERTLDGAHGFLLERGHWCCGGWQPTFPHDIASG